MLYLRECIRKTLQTLNIEREEVAAKKDGHIGRERERERGGNVYGQKERETDTQKPSVKRGDKRRLRVCQKIENYKLIVS